MSYSHLIIFLFLGLFEVDVQAGEMSPALLWSPERSMVNLPDVSSVDSFTSGNFYDHYLHPLMLKGKENAVVFLQDKLSVDDFTNHADVYSIDSQGGAFKNIKRLIEDHFSLEVPNVATPHVAVEKLKKDFPGNVHTVEGISELKSLNLGAEGNQRTLLIVNLHPVINARNEKEAIAKNDELVGDVTSLLQSKDFKYTALFTGKSAGQKFVESESDLIGGGSDQHTNRHLLETYVDADNKSCHFMNTSSNIYVFLCGGKVCVKDSTIDNGKSCAIELNITTSDSDAASSTKTNNTASVVLVYKNLNATSGEKYDVTIEMQIVLQGDRWVMKRNSFYLNQIGTAKNSTEIKNATLINRELDTVIPRPYSFHCTRLKLFVESVFDANFTRYAGTYVTLEGFQLQVFDVNGRGFFNAQDCVGFFTAGIWMGILPGLLLLFLLAYGTMMLASLSVMDKFDDPKGKTITVNVPENQ